MRVLSPVDAPSSSLTILYPCKRNPWQKLWWEKTIFEGHRLVCYETATALDVQDAEVVASAFENHRDPAAGWSVARTLQRLGDWRAFV